MEQLPNKQFKNNGSVYLPGRPLSISWLRRIEEKIKPFAPGKANKGQGEKYRSYEKHYTTPN